MLDRGPFAMAGHGQIRERRRTREQALAACRYPDILVNNAGGPPFGDFRQWSREDWIRALDANMLTPKQVPRRRG